MYAMLYGKKLNPVETHAGRLRTIGLAVKCCVYSRIACVAFLSLAQRSGCCTKADRSRSRSAFLTITAPAAAGREPCEHLLVPRQRTLDDWPSAARI